MIIYSYVLLFSVYRNLLRHIQYIKDFDNIKRETGSIERALFVKMNWKTALLAGTTMVSWVAAGCGTKDTATNGGNNGAAADKVYVVGTDASYAPFESMNGDKAEGFDIDVLNAVAEAGGFKVSYQNTPWDGIFLALNNGERDIVAS